MPVNVIGTLKPKNNGKFPVAEAVDIKVTDDLRLDKALENKADLSSVNFALNNKADKTTTTGLQNQIDQIVISSTSEAVVAPEVAAARVDIDGNSYTTLKARIDADAHITADIKSKLVEENVILIQPIVSETIGNFTISTNGDITANKNYNAYIVDLNELQKIKIDNVQVVGYFAEYPSAPYNQYQTIDETRHAYGGNPRNLDVPTGANYAVINTFVNGGSPVCINVDTGNSVPDRVDNNEESISEISEMKNQYTAYDLSNVTKVTGEFIQFNKTIAEASALNYYKVPIESGIRYAVSGYSYSNAVLFALLDENGDVLSVYPAAKPSETTEYTRIEVDTSNPQAVYIGVNDLAGGPQQLHIPPVVETITTGRMIKDTALPDRLNKNFLINDVYNSYLCTAGDSITEGIGIEGGSSIPINLRPTYGKLAADYFNMQYSNISQSGRTMADIKVNGITRNGFAVERYLLVPNDTTHLTIWFGWNDAAYGANSLRDDYCVDTYGDIYINCTAEEKAEADSHADWQATFIGAIDSDNTKTWSGAWNFVLNYFTVTKPIKHLGVIIPYLSVSEYFGSLRDRLIEICERYGVPYFDVANPHECPSIGYGDSNSPALSNAAALKSLYTADNTHPNGAGYERIAPAYINFIHRI